MTTDNVRVRIAPSPTGVPHVGTAYVGLLNLAFARKHDGKFVLRIEDTDRERSADKYEEKIYEGLRWLGIEWNEGPDLGGPKAPYRQSERKELYQEHAQTLLERGEAYECFCTPDRLKKLREQQKQEGKDIGYDGKCRDLPEEEKEQLKEEGTPYVLRLKVPRTGTTSFQDQIRGNIEVENQNIDDQILLKSDGFPTYHLANVVDDHLMGISHVMRAEEWIASTHKHVLLYDAFDWSPPEFAHLPLLRNEDKSKISKRENPVSILWYRENGYLPEALRNFLSLMGFTMPDEREMYSFEELQEEFSFDRLRTTAPVFDMEKLQWLNGKYIRNLSHEELAERIKEGGFCSASKEKIVRIAPIIQERLKTLKDIEPFAEFFFRDPSPCDPEVFLDVCESRDEAVTILKKLKTVVDETESFESEEFENRLRNLPGQLDVSGRAVFMSLRLAVTAQSSTPPIVECLKLLGSDTVRKRIAANIEKLAEST